jgi:hypothetical protein
MNSDLDKGTVHSIFKQAGLKKLFPKIGIMLLLDLSPYQEELY